MKNMTMPRMISEKEN